MSLKFTEGSIPFSKVSYFVFSIERVKLNVELSPLLIGSAAHHHIDRRLLLARIGIVLSIGWNNEIIHFFLENLPPCRVFDIAPSGPCPILETVVVFVIIDIFGTKVGVAVKFPTSGPIFVSLNSGLLVVIGHLLGRYNSQRVDQESKIFFQMC